MAINNKYQLIDNVTMNAKDKKTLILNAISKEIVSNFTFKPSQAVASTYLSYLATMDALNKDMKKLNNELNNELNKSDNERNDDTIAIARYNLAFNKRAKSYLNAQNKEFNASVKYIGESIAQSNTQNIVNILSSVLDCEFPATDIKPFILYLTKGRKKELSLNVSYDNILTLAIAILENNGGLSEKKVKANNKKYLNKVVFITESDYNNGAFNGLDNDRKTLVENTLKRYGATISDDYRKNAEKLRKLIADGKILIKPQILVAMEEKENNK